jgi:ferrous iron transport protein B
MNSPLLTPPAPSLASAGPILLVGNPNAGKTTLFNQLTGLRVKTANFPGTTLDLRTGALELAGERVQLVDMPGLYSLDSAASEEREALRAIIGDAPGRPAPSLIILLLDATNLVRNCVLASQVLELGIPTVVALNMVDIAERQGLEIDTVALGHHLNCPVVPIVARSGRGTPALLEACARVRAEAQPPLPPKLLQRTERAGHAQRYDWAELVCESCVTGGAAHGQPGSEAVDRLFVHPVAGVAVFFAVMFGVFYLIFSLAAWPMDIIDASVAFLGVQVGGLLPDGPLQSLLVDGVIGGVGSVLIFLPQICILFFCIAVLEDTGYLPRAACVMDRLLRRFGLPGKAFVPMLSAHACAIPAIMSARIIEDRRDRIITILVLPLLTCSARLPVYAMVTALLFPYEPLKGAAAFTGAYALGMLAALSMAFLFRRTLLRGETQPLMLELPQYKWPNLKNAFLAAYDRGKVFVKKAGTVILAISIVLWVLMTYPQAPEVEPATVAQAIMPHEAASEVESREGESAMAYTFAGRLGTLIEPVIEPLGFDWRIGIGIVASFAAREVVVSTLSIVYGVGEEETGPLIERLRNVTRPDGTPMFDLATCLSLLVFYVLAMQCLPTQVITARETKSWRWAVFQLGYMTTLAYTAALVTYQGVSWFT